LQDDYDCVYCIVDLHALTTLKDTAYLKSWTYDMVLDWLAAGIDPERGTLVFVQSHVPQVTELHTILSMVTPLGKLTRLPTFKERCANSPTMSTMAGGLSRADGFRHHPVQSERGAGGGGSGQPLEFTREIVRTSITSSVRC